MKDLISSICSTNTSKHRKVIHGFLRRHYRDLLNYLKDTKSQQVCLIVFSCFIFDTFIPSNFPNVPPNTWFVNHGGKRMNPNLYDCGKVCLSLLGTWHANEAEKWNPKTSTLYQLYMSIQSQILVEQPYFNEPGHERNFGTLIGNKYNKEYNDNIRYYTMCHAIYDLLTNPKLYPQFEEIIKKHFYYKKDKVIETCDKWTKEAPTSMKNSYEIVLSKIKKLLNELVI
jgi:baculoviral IAP repeat-containing protein 6